MAGVPDKFDDKRACAKCGLTMATATFCKSRGPHVSTVRFVPEDHIDRNCPRCGHQWIERTLDSKDWTLPEWKEEQRRVETEYRKREAAWSAAGIVG